MNPEIHEWLSLALRWAHIVTAMAWIGASFYFMWLDSHLEPPRHPKPGVEGDLWMVHSGGFYEVNKILVAPRDLPPHLHWFKWEAAFTWISGICLLAVVYYLGSSAFLIDPAVANIERHDALGIALILFIVGWFVYDGLYISPLAKMGHLAAAIGFLLLCGVAYGLFHIFAARAAYIHVGALMGTIMVANVWVRIIPAQRALVAATKAGTRPDPTLGLRAKQRSVHNNYMTLPVIFVMMSSHYPETYGNKYGWAILIGMFVVGAVVRHWFNLRNAGRTHWWPVPVSVAGVLLIMYLTMPARPTMEAMAATAGPAGHVPFGEVRAVFERRCVACHSRHPTDSDFVVPPKNIVFDSAAHIRGHAEDIMRTVVVAKIMPLGNVTGMTPAERALLGRWLAQGAPVN